MAGGVSRTFGVLFLIIGILLLVAGVGAALYGYTDQEDHKEEQGPLGLGEDDDRTQQNEALMAGGTAAIVGGVLFLILGIILMVVGGAQSRRAFEKEMVQATRGASATVGTSRSAPAKRSRRAAAAGTGVSGGAGGGASGGAAGAAKAGRKRARQPDADGEPPAPPGGFADPGRTRMTPLTIAAIGGGALMLILLIAFVGSGLLDTASNGSGDHPQADDPDHIGMTEKSGTLESVVTVAGNSQTPNSATQEFAAPAGTQRIWVEVFWEPGDMDPEAMQVTVEKQDGDAWASVAEGEVGVGGSFNVSDASLAQGAQMRFQIFPAEDGFVQELNYTVRLHFYRV